MARVPSPPKPFAARLWLLCMVFLIIGIVAVCQALSPVSPAPNATPAPSLQPAPSVLTGGQAESSTPSMSTHPSQPSTPPDTIIPASAVEQLYVPANDPTLVIDSPVLAMPTDCKTVIEPPMSGPHVGDVFQCMDFAMPGTTTVANTVVAGHSSFDLTTVFNRLYIQGETLIGRQIFIRTAASGDQWLAYQVQKIYEPVKDQLPYMADVWLPTPGRLILVTCMQEGNGVSTRNFIVVAQFTGVSTR